jgi:hypothetical protein
MMTTARTDKDKIGKSDILELIEVREPYSISVFLPTHISGEDVQHDRDARSLDAELRLIRVELEQSGMEAGEIDNRLAPFDELVEDSDFWRHQTQGLAVYGAGTRLITFRLPYPTTLQHRIGPSFHLLPLAPMLSGSGSFYILALELERIRLFEGNRETFTELEIHNLIPERLEERVGFDFEQKGLQFRSQHQAYSGAGYHGHDEADRDRKNEISRYFRGVDQGVLTILNKKPRPLLIASQEYLAAIYREVSAYGLIEEATLVCNLSEIREAELHRLAWEHMKPEFEKEGVLKWKKFLQYHGSGKASSNPAEILRAIYEGKVDSLFVASANDVRGTYDTGEDRLQLETQPTPFSPSLLDLAIAETLLHGGRVYTKAPDDLPKGVASMAALYRY